MDLNESKIRTHFASSADVMARTGERYAAQILEVSTRIAACLRASGKILTCGNGGSASDAEHIAAEFIGRFRRERQPLPSIALTSCTAAITAIGNDYGFDQVFARQVTGYGRPGDVLLAISTSGQSPNVLAAVHAARETGVFSIGLTGSRTGGLAQIADAVFAVPSSVTAEIQQCHIAIAHAICETVDELLSASNA